MNTISKSGDQPFWAASKKEQKEILDNALEQAFRDFPSPSSRQKMNLCEAIGNSWNGLFGMALQALSYTYLRSEEFSSSWRVPADVPSVEKIRAAAKMLKHRPAQEEAIFT